jgi:putative phosphoribosyl transferase
MFADRIDAGKKLAQALQGYVGNADVIVLGLPRGGVVLAAVVADALDAPLDVICPRKIGYPYNKEFAIGAITEKGDFVKAGGLSLAYDVPQEYLEEEIALETVNAQRRLAVFRAGMPPRQLKGKVVILVDDGLATGLTMQAAVKSARQEGAAKIVVAVPVAPREVVAMFKRLVDEAVCLEMPFNFQAVGQFYGNFAQVEDDEVVAILNGMRGNGRT